MSTADAIVQLSVPGFEYPRPDLAVPLRFAGPVITSSDSALPPWWEDIVIAGDTEDKPEVAARLVWSGAGIDLRTGRPEAAAIRRAVRTILSTPRYRTAVPALAEQIGAARGVEELVDAVSAASAVGH